MSDRLAEVLDWISANGSADERAKLARYGIPDDHAIGIAMGTMLKKAKALGLDHDLALALWASGGYEARTLAAMVGEPDSLTADQMDAWAVDFDNWAICDTVCFRLFDRTPLAWDRLPVWAASERVFTRRAAFALIWGLALHDKGAPDERFDLPLRLIEDTDHLGEPIIEKAMLMALKAVGLRNDALRARARAIAEAMVASGDKGRGRIGRGTLKALA